MRTVPSYGNLDATSLADDPTMVEVEKVYCVDLRRFTETDRASLDTIYRALPGGCREHHTPMWFGGDQDRPPFLWASPEPPGVQVYGIVSPEAWREWDAAFTTALGTCSLPLRTL